MADEDPKGASPNTRLLHAARQDDEDLLQEIFDSGQKFDINYADGLGNTALHYAAKTGSLAALELILEQDGCDVDPLNRLDRATPLHLACKLEDQETRFDVIKALLDAGADLHIRDKFGTLAVDLLPGDDAKAQALFRKAQGTNAIASGDIAEDSDGEPGSGSDDD